MIERRRADVRAAAWNLGLAALAWAASLALYLVVSRVMFAEVADLYGKLGARAPASAALYFRVSGLVWPVVAVAAGATPIVVLLSGRMAPTHLAPWARRYGLSAVLGFAWAMLGVWLWRLCVQHVGGAIR